MAQPPYILVLVFCFVVLFLHTLTVCADLTKGSQDWLNHGGNLFNTRNAYKECKISPKTAPNLRLKWKFYAGQAITATPAIFNGTLYFPSWNGYIYAVKKADGSLIWKQNLQKVTGLNATGFILNANWTVSRSTPTIAGDLLIIGIYGPAVVIALRRTTGRLVWMTYLDRFPLAIVTMSGTYYKDGFYVGVSSNEEGVSVEQCCVFRGSFAKLDARSGAILWKTYMVPENHGKIGNYAGAAIWGSSPSIDVYRNHIYIATGNLYAAPLRSRLCQERQNNQTVATHPDQCLDPQAHGNSILALDLDSGKIKWFRELGGYDVWFFACNNVSSPNCPPPGPNPDADFGEAPMMLTININRTRTDVVVAVQKSGVAWALHRDNGNIVWFTVAGPGGLEGGGTWGAATDGKRVYTNIANSEAKNFTLVPSNKTTNTGGWVAMNARNGKVLWSVANPSNATANGPVTVANGVVLVGSTQRDGPIYALNAKSGKILWSYETGGSVYGGMSVGNGCIYVGQGYNFALGFLLNMTAGTSLFAFCV